MFQAGGGGEVTASGELRSLPFGLLSKDAVDRYPAHAEGVCNGACRFTACVHPCARAIFDRSSAVGRPMNRLTQNVERLIHPHPATATVHDYHDELTPKLAASLRKRAGLDQTGFPDPRRLVRYVRPTKTARAEDPAVAASIAVASGRRTMRVARHSFTNVHKTKRPPTDADRCLAWSGPLS